MRPPFSLVFVHGDGSSVLRLTVPRWLGYGLLVIPASVAGVALALAGAQALIAYQRTELAGLHRRVEDQTQVIESFRATASTVRNELAAWKSMHANMWEALGPELGVTSNAAVGVGGTRATEDEEKLRRRLAKAQWEQSQRGWFDHVVVNDDLESASSQVAAIIGGSRTA